MGQPTCIIQPSELLQQLGSRRCAHPTRCFLWHCRASSVCRGNLLALLRGVGPRDDVDPPLFPWTCKEAAAHTPTQKDAYFDAADPLPVLDHLYVHLPMLLIRNVHTGNKWAKIDPCIGKMTEENGD